MRYPSCSKATTETQFKQGQARSKLITQIELPSLLDISRDRSQTCIPNVYTLNVDNTLNIL
jgi:hypothetical protein